MFVEERHQEILRLLYENEKVKVKELSKRFEVTEDCIRKDLASMEAKNLLKRTYGGAVLPDTLHPGHTNIVSIRKDKNIDLAILKANSPTCGSKTIYDGPFSHTFVEGNGLFAKLLKDNKIMVISEKDIE